MLARRLIPSLLLKKGRLVKGVRFRGHRDAGNPASTARVHNAQGADELMILDIDASREGRAPDLETIRSVAAECFMPLTVGGGVASLEIAEACMDAGADKLCLTTPALDDPGLIERLAHRYGSQAVVLGLDVSGPAEAPFVYDHRAGRTTRVDALAWVAEAVALGAGEIRLMTVDRDGTREGMDLALLKLVRERIRPPVIVEGGAGSLEDLKKAYDAGADAVAVGTMLVFSDNNLVKIKRFLRTNGVYMRD